MQNTKKIFLLIALTITLSLSVQLIQAKALKLSPFLKSAILPGWGQLSINKSYGYAMLTSEVLLWATYFYKTIEQDLRHCESYEYALEFAHINPGNYDSQYYSKLSKFNSSGFEAGGYNAMIRQQALTLYPDNPDLQQTYIDENAIPDEMSWFWDSIQDRQRFRGMRKDILELKNQAQLITGIIIANHILSGIDMLRLRKNWSPVKPSLSHINQTTTLNLSMEF